MEKWIKFLDATNNLKKKKKLNEISQKQLDKTNLYNFVKRKNPRLIQLKAIFDGRGDRFIIPISKGQGDVSSANDIQLLRYIEQIRKQGWTIDLTEPFGYATKVVQSTIDGQVYNNKKKVKIGPLIIALGPEAADFWQKNNKFYTTKENALYFSSEYVIVVSKKPIDILRMSDHDKWSSCHSTGGSYFKCAVAEATIGGAVAYVVNKGELANVDLNAEEIFSDSKRGVNGIQPLSRLRIRRFIYENEDVELGVPETRVYGQSIPGFYDHLKRFLLNAQSSVLQQIEEISDDDTDILDLDEWTIYGGTYEDSSARQLFKQFFEDMPEFSFGGDYSKKESGGIQREFERRNLEDEVEEIQRRTNNFLGRDGEVWSDVSTPDYEDEDDELQVSFSGQMRINVEIPEEDFDVDMNRLSTGQIRDFIESLGDINHRVGIFSRYDLEVRNETEGITKFIFELISDNYDNSVDGFNSFCSDVRDLYETIEELKFSIKHVAEMKGFLRRDEELEEVIEGLKNDFDNFDEKYFREGSDSIVMYATFSAYGLKTFHYEVEKLIGLAISSIQHHSLPKGLGNPFFRENTQRLGDIYDRILYNNLYEVIGKLNSSYQSGRISSLRLTLVDSYLDKSEQIVMNPSLFDPKVAHTEAQQDKAIKQLAMGQVVVGAELGDVYDLKRLEQLLINLKITFIKPELTDVKELVQYYRVFYDFIKFIDSNFAIIKNSISQVIKGALEKTLEEAKQKIEKELEIYDTGKRREQGTLEIPRRVNENRSKRKSKKFVFDEYTWRITE